MKLVYEFRLREKFTPLLSNLAPAVPPQPGALPRSPFRAVKIEPTSPLFHEIGELDAKLWDRSREHLFVYWEIRHSYSSAEVASAELFHLFIDRTFEPAGEECGTRYDESSACPSCGAGAAQVSSLFLDSRKLPRRKDIARTIGGEWIVSQAMTKILEHARIGGAQFHPIYHNALFEDDPLDLSMVESGRKLLEMASAQGVKPSSAEYYFWLNDPERRKLLDDARRENVRRKQARQRPRADPIDMWQQLVVPSTGIPVVSPTRAGAYPFDTGQREMERCERGDTIGLRLLSEIYVSRSKWDGSDIFVTEHFLGTRRGLLRPERPILVTARNHQLLIDSRVKGARFEIAHFV